MNKLVQKYIILILSILIPLAAAFLVGLYGYNSEKFGQGSWKQEFQEDYLSFEGEDFTTKDKILKHLEFGINSQYYSYDETPIFNQQIKNNLGEDLFKLEIYRALYKTTDNNKNEIDRFQYLYFIYNVQYLKLKEDFEADTTLRKQIDEADMPSISIKIYDAIKNDPTAGVSVNLIDSVIPDYDADVDYKSGYIINDENQTPPEGDEYVYIVAGFAPVNLDWSGDVKVEISATIDSILDVESNKLTTVVYTNNISNMTKKVTEVDTTNYHNAFRQDLTSAGYFKWVLGRYLWWICLIAFVAIGLITGSFYLVYQAELVNVLQNKNIKKGKKVKR